MHFRKTRTHFQGASNRSTDCFSQTQVNFSQGKSSANRKNQTSPIAIKNPFTSFLKKRSQKQRYFNNTKLDQTEQSALGDGVPETSAVEKKLRKMYKNSKDIVKLLKNWGFDERGCITKEELSSSITKKTGKMVSEEDIADLLKRHSGSTEYINPEGLISLLIGRSQGIPIDTMNFPLEHNNPFREKLVDNLKEDVKNYAATEKTNLTDNRINNLMSKFNTSIGRMKDTYQGKITQNKGQFFDQLKEHNHYNQFQLDLLNNIEKTIDFKKVHSLLSFHKNADYLFVDPLLRSTNMQEKQTQNFRQKHLATESDLDNITLAGKMRSLPNLLKTTLRSEDKRYPFDPISLINVDQRKTRFNQSNFTNEGSGWRANTFNQTVHPDQKDSVLGTLKGEAALKQIRYENKLTKIRNNRKLEQENIEARNEIAKQRERNHLDHIRDQQQAYNYINFIKKKWE